MADCCLFCNTLVVVVRPQLRDALSSVLVCVCVCVVLLRQRKENTQRIILLESIVAWFMSELQTPERRGKSKSLFLWFSVFERVRRVVIEMRAGADMIHAREETKTNINSACSKVQPDAQVTSSTDRTFTRLIGARFNYGRRSEWLRLAQVSVFGLCVANGRNKLSCRASSLTTKLQAKLDQANQRKSFESAQTTSTSVSILWLSLAFSLQQATLVTFL